MINTDVSLCHQAYSIMSKTFTRTLIFLGINTHILNTMFCTLPRGPDGVGVNEMKRRLLISDPDHYGVTVPCKTHVCIYFLHAYTLLSHLFLKACSLLSDTTREKRKQETEGVDYHFLSVHEFEEYILSNRYANVPLQVSLLRMLTIMPFVCVAFHFWVFHVFRFIDYGRYNGHYYGTGLDSVHRVMAEGKVCLLDVHPSVSIIFIYLFICVFVCF